VVTYPPVEKHLFISVRDTERHPEEDLMRTSNATRPIVRVQAAGPPGLSIARHIVDGHGGASGLRELKVGELFPFHYPAS
jgi:hypothetical protein